MQVMKMISKADLGWMAAVIDLKGRIYHKKNRKRATPQLVLHVQSKDRHIIARLADLTGTEPEPHDAKGPADFMRHPCREHCPKAHVHVIEYPWQMPESGTWTITGVAMGIVLFNLAPHMVTDRPFQSSNSYTYHEAMVTVFGNATLKGQGSGAVRSSALRLMNLGWRVPPKMADKLFPVHLYETSVS
jgi:hypothetical protein